MSVDPRRRDRSIWLYLAGYAVIILSIGWSTWTGIRSGIGSVERLMQDQAQSIADLVQASGAHGFSTYQRWEDEVAARLFDNARWVANRQANRPWTNQELSELAGQNQLGRVNIFDQSGAKIASSRIEPEESLVPKHDPTDYIAPILQGRVRELRIGFKEARFTGGHRFAVAVARPGGGAVVVNVFADSLRAVLESVRPGHLVSALGRAQGVRYVVLVQSDSLLAATPVNLDPATLPRLPALGRPLAREFTCALGRVYEVNRPVDLPKVGRVMVRVGLDAGPLDRARSTVRQQALLRTGVILLLLMLGVGTLLLWQRKGLLAVQVERARTDLQLRELEVQRATRLASMGQLAAHVAHEIRNPLNTIHLTAQEMARDVASPPDHQKRAEDLCAESRRIEAIVQQFLDLARPRHPQPQSLDLQAAVQAAARAAEPACRVAGLDLSVVTEPARARLDPHFFAEILENVLRNAREATPPGGRISVMLRRVGKEAHIVIDDEGSGVPFELRERVFDLFYTTRPRGTGLGLSIVSQLAAVMGGGVRFGEAEGGGARVTLRWPLEDAEG